MKSMIKNTGLALVLTAGLLISNLGFAATTVTTDLFGHEGTKDTNLTVSSMLQYALEDEHLALDSYKAIVAKYNVSRPFTNIMKAEERHIQWIEDLMAKYKMAVPNIDTSKEVVLPTSLTSIYAAGVQAEIDNIALYKTFLKHDLPEDVRDVFEALISASENHQKAFERGTRGRR